MEKSYLVSARKYRPRRFDELVAQDHVSETLKNAIKLDRLAHAYLFSGPRGVGKTTAARILAKAINCTTPLEERPEAEPCLACDSCQSFDGGRNLNVIEIDAASNNKVDDMRELRDTVRVPPQGASHKVYIVDEVHMLSQAAFNALLKTLEEPPPYALFIFATTEPHKVLPTIQSRCQRFDFRRIDVEVIDRHLRGIAKSEGVTVDDESFMLLARKGDGALRDALSAFDQAVSLCGRDIRHEELASAFRVVDVDRYFEVTRCARDRDSAAILEVVDTLVKEGYDLTEFLGGLLGHLRDLLVAISTGSTDLIEATPEVRSRYAAAASTLTEPDLLRMMMVVSTTEESLRASRQPRLNVELGLLKLVHLSRATDLNELVAALKKSGSSASGAKANPTSRSKAKRSGVESTTAESAPLEKSPGEAAPDGVAPSVPAPPAPTTPAKSESSETNSEPSTTHQPPQQPQPKAAPAKRRPERAKDAELSVDPPAERSIASEAAPSLFGKPALKVATRRSETTNSARTEGSAAVAMPTADENERAAVKRVDGVWLSFVRSVKTDRIHVGSLLQHTAPAGLTGKKLTVAVPDDFHLRLLTNQEAFLLDHIGSHLSQPITEMKFVIRTDLKADEAETDESFDPLEYMNRKRAESPVVRALFDEFGGELVW